MLQYRNPTLPSPIRSYYSEQYHPSRHEAKVFDANASMGKPTAAKVTPMASRTSTRTPKPSKDLAQINSELELAEKKNKKAEQALATWEAALKYERKVQYKYLKERVRLQKQLIKQSDHYTQLLREEAELQRQKEVKAAQQARKDMVAALRAHEEKLRTHREKITKKLQLNPPDSNSRDELVDEGELQNVASSLSPDINRPRIMNILNMRSDAEICVEDMWRQVRAHSARKMRPVENHLQHLKRSSSPFIRDFLHKIESEGYQYDSNWNSAPNSRPFSAAAKKKNETLKLMRSAAQQNKHHAAFILYRNTPNHLGRESSSFDLTMYGFTPDDLIEPHSSSSRERYHTPMIEFQTKHKKKLPLYLTRSGDILKSTSGSIDDRGSLVSQTKNEPQNKTFITQECSSTTGISTSQSSLWEPLTFNTLQEYTAVKSVSGFGPFQHGEPKLWKVPS